MRLVAAGVPKGILHMPHQGIEPVRNIQRPVRPELHIDRAKIDIDGRKQRLDFFACETGPFRADAVLLDSVKPDHIVVQKIPLGFLGEMPAAYELRSGGRPHNGRKYLHSGVLFGIRQIPRQRKPEIIVSVGGVRNEILSPPVEFVAPGICEAVAHIALQKMPAGFVPEHAGVLHADGSVRRFHLRMMEGAFLKIERPARPPYETVDGVMAVFRAETVQ